MKDLVCSKIPELLDEGEVVLYMLDDVDGENYVEVDAILALGALVAREMEWPAPGIFRLPIAQQMTIPEDVLLSIEPDGQTNRPLPL